MTKYDANSKAYTLKYAKDKLKRVPLDMKLDDYERLKAAANASGEPVNTYIKKAIQERMERDAAGSATPGGIGAAGSGLGNPQE